MISKKVIVCDLDGTLALSKSPISQNMAETICRVLSRHYMAVISGGGYDQFKKQFLSRLLCEKEVLQNLILFPTMGAACYRYDPSTNDWRKVYENMLTKEEQKQIKDALNEAMKESGFDFSGAYGEIVENRGTQVTFSGRGERAPLEVKEVWDPKQEKRRQIIEILERKIPQFEIRLGGSTSIDITRKGIDKSYAIGNIKKELHVSDEDIIFVGDALYKGGNDAPVKKTGVDYIQESWPEEAILLLKQYV